MLRWIATAMMLMTMACGSGDSGSGGEAGTATSSALESRCLDLVSRARFEEAVDVCTEAARANPERQEIAQALASARQGLGEAAANLRDSVEDAARRKDLARSADEAGR